MLRYGALLQTLKQQHNATLIAMAQDTGGSELRPNAAGDAEVKPGTVLYYIAAQRLNPAQVNWRAVALHVTNVDYTLTR